jgi:hypothetical protein
MKLTDEQKKKVADSVTAGAGLNEIQHMIRDEFGIAMTYMDVRFLIDDLGVIIKDKEIKKAAKPDLAQADVDDVEILDSENDGSGDLVPGGPSISVEVDRITKPGSIVSGTVVFSDGVKGTWMLDNMGRLALASDKPGYRPSPADVQAFQQKLAVELRKKGF